MRFTFADFAPNRFYPSLRETRMIMSISDWIHIVILLSRMRVMNLPSIMPSTRILSCFNSLSDYSWHFLSFHELHIIDTKKLFIGPLKSLDLYRHSN